MSQMLFDQPYRCCRVDEIDGTIEGARYYVSFRPSDEGFEGTSFTFLVDDPNRFHVGQDYRLFIATKEEE
jgi:hypothetical protein